MRSVLKLIAKLGKIYRYAGTCAFFVLIAFSQFDLAGIIGFSVFFASFIFRTNQEGETPEERRSLFEKLFDLDPPIT